MRQSACAGGREHGRWGGRGGPGWPGKPGWGGPQAGWGPGHHRHGHRFGRGSVRALMLTLLAEAPRHGYEIMQEIGERTGGLWQPSPGSVYPTLQQLEDEGLVRAEAADGRRVYQVTDNGREEVERLRAERGDIWQAMAPDARGARHVQLWTAMRQVGGAVVQVAREGSEAQLEEASRVLAEARRQLYRVLGEGDGAGDGE